MIDLNNYKGIYFEDDNEKYQCPETGAHFKFDDLCRRMEKIRKHRGDPNIQFDEEGNTFLVEDKPPHIAATIGTSKMALSAK